MSEPISKHYEKQMPQNETRKTIYVQVKKWDTHIELWCEVGKIDMPQNINIEKTIQEQWGDGKYQYISYCQDDITELGEVKKWATSTNSWKEVGKIDTFQNINIKKTIKEQWGDGKYQCIFYI